METMSPFFNFVFADGMPCTIWSFTDVHSTYGYLLPADGV